MQDTIPSARTSRQRTDAIFAARRRQRRAKIISYTVGLLVAAAVSVLVAWSIYAYTSSTRQVTVTVANEARVCTGSGNSVSCEYLIYTSGGTFKDADSLISGKFSSSDLYGQLQIGHRYTLEVRGYRIPILSEYPNILRIVSGPAS